MDPVEEGMVALQTIFSKSTLVQLEMRTEEDVMNVTEFDKGKNVLKDSGSRKLWKIFIMNKKHMKKKEIEFSGKLVLLILNPWNNRY